MLNVDKKTVLSVKISLTGSVFCGSTVVNRLLKIAYFQCCFSKVFTKLNLSVSFIAVSHLQ